MLLSFGHGINKRIVFFKPLVGNKKTCKFQYCIISRPFDSKAYKQLVIKLTFAMSNQTSPVCFWLIYFRLIVSCCFYFASLNSDITDYKIFKRSKHFKSEDLAQFYHHLAITTVLGSFPLFFIFFKVKLLTCHLYILYPVFFTYSDVEQALPPVAKNSLQSCF